MTVKDLTDGKRERWTVPQLAKYLKDHPDCTIKIDKSSPKYVPYLTDAELVEAVAREVLGWKEIIHYGIDRLGIMRTDFELCDQSLWFPFTDMNDLFMVLEKADEYQLTYFKTMSEDRHKKFWCIIWKDGFPVGTAHNESLPRAVLEACLTAERGNVK